MFLELEEPDRRVSRLQNHCLLNTNSWGIRYLKQLKDPCVYFYKYQVPLHVSVWLPSLNAQVEQKGLLKKPGRKGKTTASTRSHSNTIAMFRAMKRESLTPSLVTGLFCPQLRRGRSKDTDLLKDLSYREGIVLQSMNWDPQPLKHPPTNPLASRDSWRRRRQRGKA